MMKGGVVSLPDSYKESITNKWYWYVFEIALIFIPLLFWIMGTSMSRDSMGLPRQFVYRPVPVVEGAHDRPQYTTLTLPGKLYSDASNINNLTAVIDSDTAESWGGLGKIHAAKYASMCYGNREDFFLHLHTPSERMHVSSPTSFWYDAPSMTSMDYHVRELMRSIQLEKWQREGENRDTSAFFNSRSVCSCLDEVHFGLVTTLDGMSKLASKDATDVKTRMVETLVAVWNAPDTSEYASIRDYLKNDIFTHSDYDGLVINSHELPAPTTIDKLTAFVEGIRLSNIVIFDGTLNMKTATDTIQYATLYAEDDAPRAHRFCTMHAAPTHTTQFRTVMDSWTFIMWGQFVLLVSCLVSFQIGYYKVASSDNDKSEWFCVSNYKANSGNTDWWPILLAVLRIAGYGVAAVLLAVEANYKNKYLRVIDSGTDMSAFAPWQKDTLLFWISGAVLGVLIIVECIAMNFLHSTDANSKPVVIVRMFFALLQDLPNIIALGLIGVGVMLQSGVKDEFSLIMVWMVVSTTAFIQHVSNLIGICFDGFARFEETSTNSDNVLANIPAAGDGDSRIGVKGVLLRLCYVRSQVFLVAILVGLFLIGRVGVTTFHTGESDIKSMNVVLYAILFFVLLCGFDFFFELFNIESEDTRKPSTKRFSLRSIDKRWMHTLFVFVYIAFANFVTHADKF